MKTFPSIQLLTIWSCDGGSSGRPETYICVPISLLMLLSVLLLLLLVLLLLSVLLLLPVRVLLLPLLARPCQSGPPQQIDGPSPRDAFLPSVLRQNPYRIGW